MRTNPVSTFAKCLVLAAPLAFLAAGDQARAFDLTQDPDVAHNVYAGLAFTTGSPEKATTLHESGTYRLDLHVEDGTAALDLTTTSGKFFFGASLSYSGAPTVPGGGLGDGAIGSLGNPGAGWSLDSDIHGLGLAALRTGVRLTPRTVFYGAVGGAVRNATLSADYASSTTDTVVTDVVTRYGIDPVTCARFEITESQSTTTVVSSSGSYSGNQQDTGLYLGVGLWTALAPNALLKVDFTYLDFGQADATLQLNQTTAVNAFVTTEGSTAQTTSWTDRSQILKVQLKILF